MSDEQMMTIFVIVGTAVLLYVFTPAVLFVLQFAFRVPWRKYALGRHTMYLTAALGAQAGLQLFTLITGIRVDILILLVFIWIGHQLWRRNYLLHKEQGWDRKKKGASHGSTRTSTGDTALSD